MKKKALITGITGQDGAYLAKFLLKKGYEVHGIKRRSSLFNTQRVDDVYTDPHTDDQSFFLHFGDLADTSNIVRIIQEVQPDEIYNLGAMSHVMVSFEMPEYTADIDGLGTLRLMEAVRLLGLSKKTRIYQASTSELYGKVRETPQTEKTPFYPRSPYGVAKLYAYWITVNYRGILFNHESPLRGETFVTRKITRAVAKIALGLDDLVYLGNFNAKRDWGHAQDYVEAMWLMLQQDQPEDFVIATGNTTSVREFLKRAFKEVGIEIDFRGENEMEEAFVTKCSNEAYQLPAGKVVAKVDKRYFRPTEVDILLGDASKAKEKLGWEPQYNLNRLISEMVQNDLKLFAKDKYLEEGGHNTYRFYE